MKKLLFLLIAILATTTVSFGQDDALPDNLYRTTIVTKSGDTHEGVVKWQDNRPWNTNTAVKMFDEALLSEKKVKNKDKTLYKAKDVETLTFDGRTFVSRKVMMDVCDYCSTLKALPNNFFLEVVEEGTIKMFKGYGSPPGVASGVSFEEIYANILDNPSYFLEKDGMKKTTNLSTITIEKWIDDAAITYQKWTEGGFGNMKRKEGEKLMNFLKDQGANEDIGMMMNVIKEYNGEMGN
ncbi:MAG: hypothetical protein ACI85O_002315 [Saprospiraceae bacterium]|jgi:hypothetical protein